MHFSFLSANISSVWIYSPTKNYTFTIIYSPSCKCKPIWHFVLFLWNMHKVIQKNVSNVFAYIMKVNGVQNNNFHCMDRKTHNFLNIFGVWSNIKVSKLVFNLSHHTAPPASSSPCGSNELQRQSVWRSVWSPFRWASGARWCNRTARPYWHIPSRSQSYPYSRTLWIEANTTAVDYITQHHCIIGICVLMRRRMEMKTAYFHYIRLSS